MWELLLYGDCQKQLVWGFFSCLELDCAVQCLLWLPSEQQSKRQTKLGSLAVTSGRLQMSCCAKEHVDNLRLWNGNDKVCGLGGARHLHT